MMGKKYEENKLLNIIGIKSPTLKIYLCRAEFAHIKKNKNRKI